MTVKIFLVNSFAVATIRVVVMRKFSPRRPSRFLFFIYVYFFLTN